MSSIPSFAPGDLGDVSRAEPLHSIVKSRLFRVVIGSAVSAAALLAIGKGILSTYTAPPQRPAHAEQAVAAWQPESALTARGMSSASSSAPVHDRDSRFLALPPLRIINNNTRQSLELRLYDVSGHIDEQAALRLDSLLGDSRDTDLTYVTRLDRRTLQLVYRAAYHFSATTVQVVSAYRAPRGTTGSSQHAAGRAIDFRLPGVKATALAQYLRTTPRAGVGVYTHPRTQYVHLDARETSFHWLDASPPNRHWRERSIGPRSMAKLDARYRRDEDWPEGTQALAPRE